MPWQFWCIIGVLLAGYGAWLKNPELVLFGMAIMFVSLIFDLFGALAECEGKDYGKEERDRLC